MKDALTNPTLWRCALVLCIIAPLLAPGGSYAAEDFTRITLTAPPGSVRIGATVQLTVTGTRADGSTVDVTAGSAGTKYSRPESLVSISADGLVTITGAPFRTTQDTFLVWIIASNGSVAATISIVVIPTDADGDGMEDDFERRNGLNPADPADAARDNDGDGLTNLKEFQVGTNPNNRDTDGDGVSDAEEVRRGSNPLNPNSQFALNQDCLVSVLNRSALVKIGGSWSIPNVPTNMGLVRARVNCSDNGVTISGQSDFFTVPTNGVIDVFGIHLATPEPVPQSLTVTSSAATLTSAGATAQLTVIANFSNQTTKNVTAASTGTTYTTSNPAVAAVSSGGLVTAASSGTAVISALNDGALGLIRIQAVLSGDTDGDGIPDDVELSLGLDPRNPVDAQEDLDRDNLTNLREFQLGTDIRNPDTDGDGLSDGDEVNARNTNPLLADTDGDLIPDGVEVQTATNPLDVNSYDLRRATATSVVKPPSFILATSVLFPNASQQLNWKVNLIDGKTTLDLTADPRTNYNSSDLTVCNFGGPKGLVFAGNPGSAIITISNNTLSATASGTVQSFTPLPLSFVDIPGFANNVDVSGNYAYVAAGSTGLQVVDVSNRSNPRIVGSLGLAGNANDVRVVGNSAYVAAGAAGLHIVNISNPLAPALSGSRNTGGTAWDLAVKGNKVYVANGANGLVIIDVSSPSAPVQVGSISLPGTSKGVDIDAVRDIAAVALGGNGLAVVNVATPAAPTLLATLPGGDVRDVALSNNYAFLADFSRSFTAVDLTNPAAPVLRASTPQSLGGLLQDVVVNGSLAAGADVFFVNGVPMIDVTSPATPQPRLILDFRNFRDDNGTGIAMDQSFVYLTGEAGTISENGVNGTTRLYIGQYRNIQDNLGIPPTVQITAPSSGTQVIQGSTVTVTANAADDVSVAAVTFLVNGQPAFTSTTAPYQYTFTAPSTGSTLTLGASAVDFGGNVGQAANVTLNLIPDPGTTVVGKVLDKDRNPVAGALVKANGNTSATSGADGSFSIAGVPTILGSIVATASATVSGTMLSGRSPGIAPVAGGVTNVGDIIILANRMAVFGAPSTASWNIDVKNKLESTGLFTTVDAFLVSPGSPVPTLAQLQQYNAVLVYSDTSFNNNVAIGNVLADYMDGGGNVVLCTFAFWNSQGLSIQGRIKTADYLPFTVSNQSSPGGLTLVAVDPLHPILNGVSSFNGGSSSYHNSPITTAAGATLIANWSNGQPLVATRIPTAGRIVGLNFYPPSSAARGDFWLTSTDGARLMANALLWAASR